MSPRRRSTAESGVAGMLKRLTLTAALCACAGAAMAERMYVTDSLRLGLYHSEDTSDKPFLNLVSGAEVDVLERNASLARIRTPAGEEGWVKAAFLVPEKPAQLRVAELEAELAGLRSEAAESHSAHAVDETPDRVARPIVTSKDPNEAMNEALGRLKRENAAYEARLESYRGSLPMPWVAAALVLALVGGFAAGLWWLDSLIRRRHGGFRVY
jgi:SH3 domain protein